VAPGAELSRGFHAEIVAPILAGSLPGLRYAAGRLGTGSDVLGLDDAVSRDHDWGCRLTLLVDATDWRVREDALATGIEVLLAAQQALGLPVPAAGITRSRCYRTLGSQIWTDLLAGITDPEVVALPRGIGCVERWVDGAGLLASPRRRAALRVAYRAWSALGSVR